MAGTLLPAPFTYFTDDEGAPLVGGFIYTYISGTDTETPLYHDAALLNAWTNPIEIPADGKVTLYQGPVTLKMKVYDADMNLLDTYDPIQSTAINNSSLGVVVFPFNGSESYPIVVTSLPSGTTVAMIHPGSSLFTEDSSNLIGTYAIQGMMQAGSGETVTASLVNISQGNPDTPMVSIASTSTSGELQVSSDITWPAGGTDRTFAIKTKTSLGSNPGYVWSLGLVRTA